MYHFYVQGERDGKGPGTSACHYESMTEQTNTFRSTNVTFRSTNVIMVS